MESSVELGETAPAEGSGAAEEGFPVSAPIAAAPRKDAPQLTDLEKLEVWQAYKAGEMPAEIARRMGQPRVRIANLITAIKAGKLKSIGATREERGAEAEPERVEEEAVAEELAPAPSPPVLASEPAITGKAEMPTRAPQPPAPPSHDAPLDPTAYAEARQDAAIEDEGWTNAEDVIVLRGMISGLGSYETSQKLKGRKAADVVRRYKQLVPRPGVIAQAEALRRAEARLAAERGVAAE